MIKDNKKYFNIITIKVQLLIVLIMIIINCFCNFSYANLENNDCDQPKVDSRIALILDRNSKKVIYEKNGFKKVPMASTTKIMTSIIVLENAKLNDIVTIDKKAASIGGSRLGLKTNDKITVNDLLYGLLLRSGNDAAVALANFIAGNIEEFANMMNEKARKMGWNNSYFITPHGLDNKNHYTTAYELACMADYAFQNETFKKIVGTKNIIIHINGIPKEINNTNELLGNLEGIYGVKTGFTNGAGRCLVTSYKKQDIDIITVILGADTKNIRTKDSVNLIEYIDKNYEDINIKELIEEKFESWKLLNTNRIYIFKGQKNKVDLKISELPYENLLLLKKNKNKIDIEINSIRELEAPVYENEKIGDVKLKINGETIEIFDLLISEDIKRKNIEDYLIEFGNIIFRNKRINKI